MGFHRKPTKYVDHVKLKVKNLEHSLTFYQETIGFKVLERTKTTAQLTADGQTSILSIEQPTDIVPSQGRYTGLYHFALLLPKRSDLAAIVYHFIEKGVKIGAADHLVSEALYLSDPDGNGIEIYVDRNPSEWEWNDGEVAMATDPLNFEDLLSVGKQGTWQGLPASTIMGHIHLHVSELKKTEQFYVDGLGLEVVNRYGNQALFISSGKYHHHIGVNTWKGVGAPVAPANHVGLHAFSLILPNEEEKQRIIARLKSIGASVSEENGDIVTADPSGNRIVLT